MMFSKIIATGAYLPEKILTNDDLTKMVETSDEWIFTRSGIKRRHIVSESDSTTSMGAKAAKQALETAGWSPNDVDMIVVATCTADKIFPATACLIQEQLGIPPCIAFDVQAACSGFIYGLSVVDQFVRTGMAKRALLIGSETLSRVVDWKDRKTCVLFGDGAGAVLFEASSTPGVIATKLVADGRQKEVLYLDNAPNSYMQMQGNTLFKFAVNLLAKVASETLQDNNLTVQDIDWLVPHQANIRIIQATAEKLGMQMDRVVNTLEEHGNTSAASIPLALDKAIRDNKIKRGQHLLLEAFGGGLTWGTALIRY